MFYTIQTKFYPYLLVAHTVGHFLNRRGTIKLLRNILLQVVSLVRRNLMPEIERLRGRNPAFTTITWVIVKAKNQNLSLLRNTGTSIYLTTRITTLRPFRVSAGNAALTAFHKMPTVVVHAFQFNVFCSLYCVFLLQIFKQNFGNVFFRLGWKIKWADWK
jgi:hypothetical protein